MEKQFYQTKIEESFGNLYVKVFVDEPSIVGMVKAIIQLSKCAKRVDIKDCVDTNGGIFQAIYVFPDSGIKPLDINILRELEIRIHNALNEIDDEILIMRKRLLKNPIALRIFDIIIRKMYIGKYDQSLIDNMNNLLKVIRTQKTNVQAVSLGSQTDISDEKIRETVTKLFDAIRAVILVNNN